VRPDARALAFGSAFTALGALGLAHELGADVRARWLYAAVLVTLGLAGLVSSVLGRRDGAR
jgi:hypothetical protein